MLCFRKFLVAKMFMDKREVEVSRFSFRNFLSQCRKISSRNPSVLYFRKFPVAKKFMDRREGEVSRFSCRNFLSHSAEKFRRGTLLCCVSESFW